MAILRFATNIPQCVSLRSLDPKIVDSQFGGVQHMFTAEEGIFYVSDKVGGILADQFAKLGVKPGQPVEITKAETGNGTGRKTQWIVSAQSDADEAPSELECKLAESIALAQARKQPQPAAAPEQPAWARALANQTKQLIDVYAEAVAYASQRHGNAVKPEDVRSMMTTLFINMSKNGGSANAA